MAQSHPARTECFFDGACPGNQLEKRGPMRAAYVIGGHEYVRHVPDLDTARGTLRSNNIAEYAALVFLLRRLREIESETGRRGAYVIHGDSQLVIRQMKGRYRVKADHLRALNSEAKSLAAQLDVTFQEIPRSRNKAGFLLEREGARVFRDERKSEATREN
ncbi:MAG TPA: ribonuclease HI family protein [Thermoplasmata archaeon]|nr:ribonuclease HI family protein [Thermoplasmata archaeon]